MNPTVPFEDAYTDIVRKAQRGIGLKDIDLMMQSGASMIALLDFLEGNFDPDIAHRITPFLHLDALALTQLATNTLTTPVFDLPQLHPWILPFPLPGYPQQSVNAFTLEFPNQTNILFDTGLDLTPVIHGYQTQNRPPPSAILITHHHHDHVEGITQAQQSWPDVPIYAPEALRLPSTLPFPSKDSLTFAGQSIRIRPTPGHSPEAVTYLYQSDLHSFAFVGDAIFAASIGKIPHQAYASGLDAIRTEILSLPPQTILCPGHGPLTSVEQELKSNPFFANN